MSNNGYPFVFVDESGVADSLKNNQPFFAIGFLKIYNPEPIITKLLQNHFGHSSFVKQSRKSSLENLKENRRELTEKELTQLLHKTSHQEYHFSNITQYNIEHYKNFISILANEDFEFRVLILKRKNNWQEFASTFNYWNNYLESVSWLAKYIASEKEKCIIIADYCSSPALNQENAMSNNILKLRGVANVLRNESIGCPLLQMCDVLLGSVVFQFKELYEFNNNSNKVRIKREFISYMKHKFDFICDEKDLFLTKNISNFNSTRKMIIWKKYAKNNSIFETIER